jgi:hypothetical protein
MSDTAWRIIRSLVQLVAGGGAGVFFTQVATDIGKDHPTVVPYITMLGALIAVIAQNVVESWKGERLIGPTVVSKPAAEQAVENAYTATPGVDPMPQVKV